MKYYYYNYDNNNNNYYYYLWFLVKLTKLLRLDSIHKSETF